MDTQMRMNNSSSNPRKNIPSFFKIFLDDTATNLTLPPAFAKKQFMEGRFPENPVLQITESGGKWGVEMVKIGEKCCFGKGWLEFVKDTKTQVGDFLVFWLIGKSTFQVSIYSPNGCEKDLSSVTPTTCKCVCYCSRSKFAKSVLNETTKTVIKMEEEDDDREDEDEDENDEEKETEPQNFDWMEECTNLSFEKVLKKSHIYTMALPKNFVHETGLDSQRKTMVRNKEGKEWPVKIGRWDDGRFCLANGWSNFYKENKIMEGDTCSFRYSHGEGGGIGLFQFEFVKKVERKRGRPPLNRSLGP